MKTVKCVDCGKVCELGRNATSEQRGLFRRWVNVCDECSGVTRDKYGRYWDAEERANGQEHMDKDGNIELVRWEDVKE